MSIKKTPIIPDKKYRSARITMGKAQTATDEESTES
jgi:hypothetical protein